MIHGSRCVNKQDLVRVCVEYVSLVTSRVTSGVIVKQHLLISEMTGISYDELKQYLWHLDEFGYNTRLEEMEFGEEKRYIIRKIGERLVGKLLDVIEDRMRGFFENNPDVALDLEKYGYDVDSWIEEWKTNGYWLCDGEPVLKPVN